MQKILELIVLIIIISPVVYIVYSFISMFFEEE